MAQFQHHDIDYMVADYGMADFDDNVEDELHISRRGDVDSETEDDFDGSNNSPDTTVVQARRGKDIQGIPWDRLNYARAKYRETRLQQYKNFESVPRPCHDVDKECKHAEKGSNFYGFRHNTRSVKPTIVHFQVQH